MTYEEFSNDVDKLVALDDTPIPGMEEAFTAWKERPAIPPPPQPGEYSAMISKIHKFSQFPITDANGIASNIFQASIDLKIVGGDEDGSYVNYLNVNAMLNRFSGSCLALDLVKSAGITGIVRSNADFKRAFETIQAGNMLVRFPLDWEAFCLQCFNASLIEQTGQSELSIAKQLATKDQKKAANLVALKAKSYKSFKMSEDGKYIPMWTCEKHGDFMARAKVTRFLAPVNQA